MPAGPHLLPRGSLHARRHRSRGQAAVETLAVLPALVLAALAAGWVVWAAAAWVQAAGAARAGARAALVGEDPAAAARRVLPGAGVVAAPPAPPPGVVTVRVRLPLRAPGGALTVEASGAALLP
jgi:Flp pilus assembly protein TadG